ncbi:transmembrane protein 252 [Clupea harengus]|uniref:Transmembrane protein 252 n=1 Tax=Clupea harengus TaxID=7950 RepID=A0A6P3VMP5_CLUHA|nr:transmembrane protein 252 [Clupea harengus]
MDKKKRLGAALRLILLFFGFSFICVGAYLKSLEGGSKVTVPAVFAYLMVAGGFLLLLMGAFWSICHGMRSSLYRQRRHRRRSTQVYVYTVDRPNFYPPSYEESQAETNTINQVCFCMAPPLYTPTGSEMVNEAFSHEQPPTYDQVLGQHQQSPGGPPEGPFSQTR